MWPFVKRILSHSETLSVIFGDIVFQTESENGVRQRSFIQWKVKKALRGNEFYVSLAMISDAYEGPEGSPTNYMSFDLAKAKRLRDKLDQCIQYIEEGKHE
jgi:hypothetical protein